MIYTTMKRVMITFALTALILLESGCASGRASTGTKGAKPDAEKVPKVSGLTYFLPRTILEVDAIRTTYTQQVIKNNALAWNDSVEIKADVKPLTVAEHSAHSLDLSSGALRDASLTVSVSPEGFLQGINSSSQGKSGEFLSNVLQIAGRVLALGGLGAAPPASALPPPNPYTCLGNELPADIREDAFNEAGGNWLPDKSWFGSDEVGFFFVTHSGSGCTAWKDLIVAERATRHQQAELRELEAALTGKYGQDAEQLESRVRRAETLLRRLQATEAGLRVAHGTLLSKFKVDYYFTPQVQKDKTVTAHVFLDLSDLPHASLFAGKKDAADIRKILHDNKLSKMNTLSSVGMVLAIDDPQASPPASDGQQGDQANECSSGSSDMTIAYREPRAVRLAVYEENPAAKEFRRTGERLIQAFGATRCIDVRTSNWANRALVVEFGSHGIPKSLQRTDGSTLAAATSGVASAVSSLQNAYAESLQKLVDIEKTRRELAQSDLLEDIAVTQREKELIDARVALAGASASQDLLLQQRIAQERLTLLQRELDLKKAEQAFDPQLELAALKDRLAILEQQLAVLQAQRKLEEASKP